MNKLQVIELFAGVGGFRLGLENTGNYEIVWSNQWEPSTKAQHASMVYEARFGPENHSNKDISEVLTSEIPDADILVGGFPCQDYSVATTLQNSKGLIGKKGVLWWSIHRILSEKVSPPKYLFLENVDRLLKSPSSQRGRDFAIMLKSLDDLGYAVEWRIINAADYGMPQRRRRIFFLGYHKSTTLYKSLLKVNKKEWIQHSGVLPKALPVNKLLEKYHEFGLKGDLVEISEQFNLGEKLSPFENSGVLMKGQVHTAKTSPAY
ncbi:MAG: DNA (cytosine-5-)-methyltransferase, partial [Maribacter sp.]|nr:DNA (cytosine-5-)-methyltransferase [Maribacter sp.]